MAPPIDRLKSAFDRLLSAGLPAWWRAGTSRFSAKYHYKWTRPYLLLRYLHQSIEYTAPARPCRPVAIDPSAIECEVAVGSRRHGGLGQIVPGSWDEDTSPLRTHSTVKGLRERFEEGRAWEDTVYWEETKRVIDEQGHRWGHPTLEEFKDVRCSYLESMYRQMTESGYVHRPRETVEYGAGSTGRGTTGYPGRKPWHRFEPILCIGRAGDPLLWDGRHRLTIARIAGIDTVPTNILIRHARWQGIRDHIAGAATDGPIKPARSHFQSHPDLEDIVCRSGRDARGIQSTIAVGIRGGRPQANAHP